MGVIFLPDERGGRSLVVPLLEVIHVQHLILFNKLKKFCTQPWYIYCIPLFKCPWGHYILQKICKKTSYYFVNFCLEKNNFWDLKGGGRILEGVYGMILCVPGSSVPVHAACVVGREATVGGPRQ